MNRNPLRLVTTRWKAVYVVGGLLATMGIFLLINLIPNEGVTGVTTSILQFAWIYYATRIFRGSEELLVAPRPWWRMTARPLAGILLAVGFLCLLAFSLISALTSPALVITYSAGVVEYAALAFLYAGSSIRLRQIATRPDST